MKFLILGGNHNNFLFSKDSKDLTQKNLIWYLFGDLYKNDNEMIFNNNNSVEYLNILIQVFKESLDLSPKMAKEITNVKKYFDLMQETQMSEKLLKSLIETLTIKSYLNQSLVNFIDSKGKKVFSIDDYLHIGKEFSNEEKTFLHKLNKIIYEITMNDIMKFNNGGNLFNFLKEIYFTSQNIIKNLKEEQEFKGFHLPSISAESKNDFLMSKAFLEHFENNLSKIFEWYELNNKILYNVDTIKVYSLLVDILNDKETIKLNFYKNNKEMSVEEQKEIIKNIISDVRFQEFLEYSNVILYQDGNVYNLNVLENQKEISNGNVGGFYNEFEFLNLEMKQKILKEMIGIKNIYVDGLNENQKAALDSKSVSDYFNKILERVIKSGLYSKDELYKVIKFFNSNQNNLDLVLSENDNLNNFMYYFHLMYTDLESLILQGDIENIENVNILEGVFSNMLKKLLTEDTINFEVDYFDYQSKISLVLKDSYFSRSDLNAIDDFEKDVMSILEQRLELEYIQDFYTIIKEIREYFLQNKDSDTFEILESEIVDNHLASKAFLYRKTLSDYVTINRRFDKDLTVQTAKKIGVIESIVDTQEFTDAVIQTLQDTKSVFSSLDNLKELSKADSSLDIVDSEKSISNNYHLEMMKQEENNLLQSIATVYEGNVGNTLQRNFQRVYDFIKNENVTNGQTLYNLVVARFEELFASLKERKDLETVIHKAYFISTKDQDMNFDDPVVKAALAHAAKSNKINVVLGNFVYEEVASEAVGFFSLDMEPILKVEVEDSIFLDPNVKILNFVNKHLIEEVKSKLGLEDGKGIDEIHFKIASEIAEVSYMESGRLLAIPKVVRL